MLQLEKNGRVEFVPVILKKGHIPEEEKEKEEEEEERRWQTILGFYSKKICRIFYKSCESCDIMIRLLSLDVGT